MTTKVTMDLIPSLRLLFLATALLEGGKSSPALLEGGKSSHHIVGICGFPFKRLLVVLIPLGYVITHILHSHYEYAQGLFALLLGLSEGDAVVVFDQRVLKVCLEILVGPVFHFAFENVRLCFLG